MAEQAAAASTETAPSLSQGNPLASLGDIAAILAGAEPVAAETPAAAPAKPAPRAVPGLVDPLDEAEFADDKLTTPEAIRAAAAKIQTERKLAIDLRKKADNRAAEAVRKEAKFAKTKGGVLQEKSATTAQANFLAGELAELQSGDPSRFIAAVARLSKHPDPPAFWRDVAVSLAKGEGPKKEPEIPKEVKERLDKIEAERVAEREAAEQRQFETQMWELRRAQVQFAQTSEEHVRLSQIARDNPRGVDEELIKIRTAHHKQTGQALDIKSACDILEQGLQDQFELLQRTGNRSAALNGEKGAATPAVDLTRQSEQQTAKPEPALSSPLKTQSVTAIPASLAGAPSATTRGLSDAEVRQAQIVELEKLGIYRKLGM